MASSTVAPRHGSPAGELGERRRLAAQRLELRPLAVDRVQEH